VLSGIKIGAVPKLPGRVRPAYVLAVILIAGAALRLWTIGSGAPYEIGVDEPVIIDTAVRMIKTGDFNLTFYDYGGLTYYLQAAVASARFLVGAMNREWTSLDQVWEGDFYVWARATTALLGVLTIVLVYRAGLRLGVAAALFAALAMALQPQHIRESHFALTDVPMTFFVVLTLVQSLSASQHPRPLEFLFAGIAVGLAAATKYNAALAIVMPLCALSQIKAIRLFAASTTAVLGGAAIGFVIGAPYAILNLPGFLNGFARLLGFYNIDPSWTEGARVYWTHILQWSGWPGVLWRIVAAPALLACFYGLWVIARELRDPEKRARSLILIVFPAVYFWFIAGQSLRFGRYALPLAPFLCLWFGVGAARLVTFLSGPGALPRRTWTAVALVVLILTPALGASVAFNARRLARSPTEQAARWLVSEVKPNEHVAIEGRAYMQLPPLQIKTLRLNRLIDQSLDTIRAKGVVYLVASSAEYETFLSNPQRDPARAAAYTDLFRSTETVQVFPSANQNVWPTIRILRIQN
jgi:4-amino-4-deoxy-L-arabinose transferase-like glycosyltransferase